jgi:hypothetical protein
MKQVNFNHPGGFPLEQETLERLQTAYRSELYEALKGHLSIENGTNYIITPATTDTKGWAIIHQEEKDQKDPNHKLKTEGILYPINEIDSSLYKNDLNLYKIDSNNFALRYLKTTRTGTNLIYGTGTSETAYFDYEAKYIDLAEHNAAVGASQNNDALTVYYYDLEKFEIVKDIKGIEKLISDTNSAISALSNSVTASLALKADKTEVVNLANSVNNSLALKANLASPSFTGEVTSENIGNFGKASNNPEVGRWNPLYSAIEACQALTKDEEFAFSNNNVNIYDNNSTGTITITREANSQAPNASAYHLKVVHTGTNQPQPDNGGVHQSIHSKPNKTYVQRFRANLPIGLNFALAENAQGANNTSYWLTSTVGTGKWEEYIRVSHTGNTGTFSTTGHIYISGILKPITWYIASMGWYDATSINKAFLPHQDGNRYTTDFNKLLTSGFYNGEGQPPNAPGNYGQLIVAKGIDTGLQVFGGYNNDNLWFRGWANYGAQFYDWRKIYHNENLKTSPEIIKLKERIDALEINSGVPKGMIAIWGRPANEIPDGWYEYTEMRGRMPVGLLPNDPDFGTLGHNSYSGAKNKTLSISEIPPHTHIETRIKDGAGTIINYDAVGDDRHAGYESVASGTTGGGQAFSILNPYRVVLFIEYTGIPHDKIAPSPPTSLTATSTSNSVTLNWVASSSNDVTNYLVSNFLYTDTLKNDSLTHTFTQLLPSTEHSFTVIARDAAGNVSASTDITVTTSAAAGDTIQPNAPVITSTSHNISQRISTSWSIPYDNVGVTEYELWRSEDFNAFVSISTQTDTTYFDLNVNYDTIYKYMVRAKDAAGNWSGDSNITSEILTDPTNNCFDTESLVTMASGQSKKLKNIIIGDKLHGFSFPNEIDESNGDYTLWRGKLNEASKTEVTVVNKKTALVDNYYEITTQDGSVIKVTGEHSLLTTQDGENIQWVRTKNVSENMSLIDKSGKTKVIESITFKEEPLEVGVLDVESVDNYVIAGIVAHNATINREVAEK